MDVLRHGILPRDATDAINAAFREVHSLLEMRAVEGSPLLVNRDPTGWWIDFNGTAPANFTGGTSGSASESPPGVWSFPTQTVTGPPSWTPATDTYPTVWNSASSTLYAWDGSVWKVVIGVYPTTTAAATPPTSQLIIPTITAGLVPTYSTTKGAILCEGTFIYQYSGTTWIPYYPLNTVPGTTSSTSVAPVTFPVFPTLTATGTPTFTVTEGTPIYNTVDNQLYISLGGGLVTQMLDLKSAGVYPTVTTPSTAITGYMTLPTITDTGTPTMTLPEGTPVWNKADDKIYISLGGGSFQEITGGGSVGGTGTADTVAKWSATSTLTDSNITDDGGTVAVTFGGNAVLSLTSSALVLGHSSCSSVTLSAAGDTLLLDSSGTKPSGVGNSKAVVTDSGGYLTALSAAAAIADVSGTADVTYSTNEQDLINDLVTAVNALLAANRAAFIVTP